MTKEFKLRSISDKENYATYLALPLLQLSKYSFGEGNFMNSYLTVNGQIGVLVKDIDNCGWAVEEHRSYVTDRPYYDGVLIVFKPAVGFEKDILTLLEGKYSQLSELAMQQIEQHSGLHVDYPQPGGGTFSSRLISIIRKDPAYRTQLEERLGTHLEESEELEPKLRDQDVLYDVDTDIDFVHQGFEEDAKKRNQEG
jgi:hypothetical protein